jgi:hypothetical protein
MTSIVVESNVPLPNRQGGRPSKYPWNKMQLGDSFALPIDEHSRVVQAAYNFTYRHPEFVFSVRNMKDGTCRVWRVPARKRRKVSN